MTRASFLAFFGLGAAGQTASIPGHGGTALVLYKPRNGECPVCGTMAAAYVRDKALTYYYSDGVGHGWKEILAEPATRTISCAHCRVRFDQDAEEGK